MAVYQVAFIFESDNDADAQVVADELVEVISTMEEEDFADKAKVSFTKFEREAPEVADKPVV